MKNKKFTLIVLSILLVGIGYSYWSKIHKDNWAKEAPKIKYSEARENEVWGGAY